MTSRKQIEIIGPVWPYRGGISHNTAALAQTLGEDKFSVRITSFYRQFPKLLYPGVTDKDNSSDKPHIEADYILDFLNPYSWRKAVLFILNRNPDLVCIQWWTTFWAIPFGIIAASLKKKNIDVLFIVHNVFPHEPRIFDRVLAKFALSKTNKYLVHSRNEYVRLRKIFPLSTTVITPLPVYTIGSGRKESKQSACKKLGIQNNNLIFLFFGFVRPYKGLLIILKSLEMLKRNNIKPFLLIAGEFWEDKEMYLNKINQYNLTDQIKIIDHYIPNEDVATIFSAADYLLAPYLEGATQSAVVSLGMGYKVRMIISDIVAQGFDDLDLEYFQVVKTGDENSLYNAMLNSVQNEIRIKRDEISFQSKNNLVQAISKLMNS